MTFTYSQAEIDQERAALAAMKMLADEWRAMKCSVCGSDKWTNHPFCRSCSIRLQRAHMMRALKPFCGHDMERIMRTPRALRKWFTLYDCARDFLIVTPEDSLMAQHYTRSTVSASAWCSKCQRSTQHRVDGGRRGPCLECIAKLDESAAKPKPAPKAEQQGLFGGEGSK